MSYCHSISVIACLLFLHFRFWILFTIYLYKFRQWLILNAKDYEFDNLNNESTLKSVIPANAGISYPHQQGIPAFAAV
jgi:hypothetical protein